MEPVAGLDIGSSRVIAAVSGAKSQLSDLVVREVKYGYSCAMGIRKGQVVDVPSLAGSIREALDKAESEAGIKVESVYTGFSGHTVEFYIKNSGSLLGKGRRVNQQDIEKVIRLSLVANLQPGRRVIEVIPYEYYLDGMPVNGSPVGMSCTRLNIDSLIITVDNGLYEKLTEAAHMAGVRIKGCLPSTLAAGESVLSNARRQVGVVLADIGESCTSVIMYNHGRPLGFEALPVGSGHITSDMAICLRTTLEGAEEAKRQAGIILQADEGGPGGDPIAVPRLSGLGFNQIPRNNAARVIEARAAEIFDMLRSSVNKLSGGFDLPGGIVFAGGGSLISGLGLFAKNYFNCEVEIASLENISNGNNNIIPLDYAGALGLLKYFSKRLDTPQDKQDQENLLNKVMGFFRILK